MPALLNTSKHMQYPPNQHNWATDSVCCTVKECGRSRVQHTARIATVTSQLNTKYNSHTPSQAASLSLPLLSYHIANAYNNTDKMAILPSVKSITQRRSEEHTS